MSTTRRWLIWVVASEVLDDEIGNKEAADEAAEALLDDIVFYLRNQIQLSDVRPFGVQGMSIKDDGVKEYQRSTKRYSALPIMLDIASYRSGT